MSTLAQGLVTLDWIVIACYGLGMLALGWWVSRRQHSLRDYFVAGGTMGAFSVGVSMFATVFSLISYLSTPGEMIGYGPAYLWSVAAIPFYYVVGAYVLIPTLMRHRYTSAYALLEDRMGLGVRLMAATMFLLMRLVWMGLMIYLAANALRVMLDLDEDVMLYLVLACTFLAVGYTMMGGLRAVVITDVVQSFLMLLGALLTIGMITWEMGGFSWWPTTRAAHWQSQPFVSLDPHVRVTTVGTILSITLFWVCTSGADQVILQRYMATRNLRSARRSYLVNAIAKGVVTLMLGIVGFALLGFYARPEAGGAGGTELVAAADDLFLRFIAMELPPGVTGLIVSALFAAVMSSVDSGVNSVTAVIQTDFVNRLGRSRRLSNGAAAGRDAAELRSARWLTLIIGLAVAAMGMLVGRVSGNILEVTTKTTNLLLPPLFVVMALTLFVPSATRRGVVFGGIYGTAAGVLFAFWDAFTGRPALSFQWISAVSLVTGLTTGLALSCVPAAWSATRGRALTVDALAALPLVAVGVWLIGRA